MDKSLIERIVRATGVQANEMILVHFWGEDKDIATMHHFASAVAALGASPIELQQSRSVNYQRFSSLTQRPYGDAYFDLYKNLDAVIDIFNYQPVVLNQKLEEEQMGYYRQYMASIFRVLVQAKRFSQIRLPSVDNADESGLSPEEFTERILRAYDVDYDEIRIAGQNRVAKLSQEKTFSLVTGQGSILNFNLEDRQWHIDAGDGDMPCGEVYIAPVEELTVGDVYFERLYTQEYGIYDNIVLHIDAGVIVGSNKEEFNECLTKLDAQDKTVCELGFGINPNITTLCGYTVLDEKALATFHIAIGNNTLFGGKNESQQHIDFVGKNKS